MIKEKGVRRHTPTKIKKKIIKISKPTKEKKYHYYNAEHVVKGDDDKRKKSNSPEGSRSLERNKKDTLKSKIERDRENDKRMFLRSSQGGGNNINKILAAKSKSIEKVEVDVERVNNFKKPKKNEVM